MKYFKELSAKKETEFPSGLFKSSMIKSDSGKELTSADRGRVTFRINKDQTGESIERYLICNSFIKTTFAWERSENNLLLKDVRHFQKYDSEDYTFAGIGSDRWIQFLKITDDFLITRSAFREDTVLLEKKA